MLLCPIYWFTSDPFHVYRSAQVLNAVINAATFPLAYLFARRVFALPRKWALGGAFVVATMPAVVFYGQFAMADAVLATLGLGWLLLIHTWLATDSTRMRFLAAAGSGAVAGIIYVMHVRGIMVVLAHFVVIALFLLLRRVSWPQAVVTVLLVCAGGALDSALKATLHDKIITLGSSPGSKAASALTTLHGLALTTSRIFGQVWYLSFGTWGLGAVALAAFLMSMWPLWPLREVRQRPSDRVEGTRTLMMVTTFVTTALVALSSSMSLPTYDHRINYFAYPRYIHFLFPIWMLAGIFALRGASRKRVMTLAIGAGTLALGSAAVTYASVRTSKAFRFLAFDVPETSFLSWKWDAIQIAKPTVLGLVIAAAVLVALPRRRTAAAAMAAVVVLQMACMFVSVEKISKPMVVNQYLSSTPRLVRDAHLHPGDLVAESVNTPWYLRFNHMREVTWSRLLMFDNLKENPPAAANIVIAPYGSVKPKDDWRPGPEFQLVAVDQTNRWAVWRRN